MKALEIIGLIIGIIAIYLLGLVTGLSNAEKFTQPEQPATLDMELYSVTPHGHQVFKKCENGCCVYTFIRAYDGYPIAITSTCK